MKIRFSRAVTAVGLGVSLWVSSVAALAAPQQPKDQPQSQTQPAPTKTDQKAQTTDPKAAPQQPASNKTLSTNEDPTMIGKRNINKGLWGKLAAGTDKEVRAGRMLAAEVDKEAKFIDDPIITEYVNRVGRTSSFIQTPR